MILIMAILLIGSVHAAVTEEWAKSYDLGGSDKATGVVVDNNDTTYVTGVQELSGPNNNFYTMKLDRDGNRIWQEQYDVTEWDYADGITSDSDNNIYVVGRFNGNSQIVKYDSSGNQLWSKTYDNGGSEAAYAVATDSNNNVYVAGREGDDYFTLKYDSSGTLLWNRIFDAGPDDRAYGIAIDSDDNVYVTGFSEDDSIMDQLTVKYDSSGNLVWNKSYDSGNADYAWGITIDNNDNVLVVGYSNDGNTNNYLTTKYDSTGNHIWSTSYDSGNSDAGRSVVTDSVGNIYVTGYSNDGNTLNCHTIKYDATGDEVWNVTYDGGNTDLALDVAVDSAKNVYVVGREHDGTDYNYLILKYSQTSPPITISNSSPTDGATDVSLNPTLNVTVSDPDGDSMNVSFYGTGPDPWNLSGLSYDGVSIPTKNGDVEGIFFKPDGTKMYQIGSYNNDKIFEFSCSTPWELKTCSYTGVNIGAADSKPKDLFFNPDGTRLYETGGMTDEIHQHTCSTPWDLSTCSTFHKSIPHQYEYSSVADISFGEDGQKFYEVDFNADKIFQYTCSTPWEIDTCTHNGVTKSVTYPIGISFKLDGTKMFVLNGAGSNYIYQNTCTTPWHLDSCSYNGISIAAQYQGGFVYDLFINDNGTKLYELDSETIYQSSFEGLNLMGTFEGINSGSSATYQWDNLSEDTTYNWYAVADDGTGTTQSPTWSFTTTFTMPITESFSSNPKTTDFSTVENLSSVENLTLATNYGVISFDNKTVNAEGQDYDNNIIFGDCFVAVNSSNLDYSFNATAYLLMNNSDGHCGDNTIFTSNDVVADAGAIKTSANLCNDCHEISVNGDLVKYRVPHFSSYAIGSNSNMTIDADDPKQINQTVTFTAVYRNSTSGDFISGATCDIGLDNGTTATMAEGTEEYTYQTSFAAADTYNYNVTCSATGYNTLKTDDSFEITSSNQIPEFNSIAILAILVTIILGLFYRSKKAR